MKKLFLLFSILLLSLSACTGGAEEKFDPNTCITIIGDEKADGGWIVNRIEFCEEANHNPIEIDQSSAEVTLSSSSSSKYSLSNSTTLWEGEYLPLAFEYDKVTYSAGELYNYKGTIYWYPLELTPFWLQ